MYSAKSDSFALGIIIYFLIFREFPWNGSNLAKLMEDEAPFSLSNYRLLFLQGILSADLDRIKTQFLQTFGFEHLITFDRMRQMGLIAVRESSIVAMPRDKNSAAILPPFQAVSSAKRKYFWRRG